MYGPECRGGGEDTIAHEKKLRCLQLLKDFNCTVTSTWTNNEDNREFHTWRAWGCRVRKKQLDYITGPKETRSTTWHLNQVRLRTWDHFPAIGPDGCPSQKLKKQSSKNRCSGPQGDLGETALRDAEEGEGLVLPHERLVGAAAEVKATTTSSRKQEHSLCT